MNENISLTLFITAWNWQILAILFLCFAFVFLALPQTLMTNVFFVSFIFIFIGCEAMAIKRRKKFDENY